MSESQLELVVYSLPESSCQQCKNTKNFLKRSRVPFEVVDITTDQKRYDEEAAHLGFMEAPICVLYEVDSDGERKILEKWSNYRHEEILKAKKLFSSRGELVQDQALQEELVAS